MSKKVITIFGTARAKPNDEVYKFACDIGKTLAQNGFAIATGGYGGIMLASSQGARSAGGEVYGITCKIFNRTVNEFVTEEIQTDNLQKRLDKLIEIGDGYIVLPGGTGTLLELAMVWELKNKKFLTANKPVIAAGNFWKDLIETIAKDDAKSVQCIRQAQTAIEIVDILKSEI